MSDSITDRNLLFGILALQNNFVSREALLAAFDAWIVEKKRSLADILTEQKRLTKPQVELLRALAEEHVKQHGNDPAQSLAAVSSIGSLRDELQRLGDAQLEASLVAVAQNPPYDPYPTAQVSVGEWSSSGSRFRIVRPHRKGGLGEVFVAEDLELHREVALKEIQSRYADQANSRSRFKMEAEITGGLEHPGIVPVYGLGEYADGRPFYAMRFIRGDSLRDAIERFHKADSPNRDPGERTLELRKLLGRFIDVCEAMEYAHSRRVLHRDLKPGNIMLGKFGETLIVDWGLAKPIGRVESGRTETIDDQPPISTSSGTEPTALGSAVGTPAYMSPEQAAGRSDLLGTASDIYGLGATLYHLLTGESPVTGQDVGAVLRKVERGDFPTARQRNASVPAGLSAICGKAMALKPADRYASPSELVKDVEHWLADEPIQAWPEPWPARAKRWMRRHRNLVGSVAAATLICVVALSVSLWLVNEARQRAEINRQRAESNFQLAREAVGRFFITVGEEDLRNKPGLQTLQDNLLNEALAYYEKFNAEVASSESVTEELGLRLFGTARSHERLGKTQEAITDYEKSRELQERLLAERPESMQRLRALSNTLNALGRVHQNINDFPKALDSLQKAHRLRETYASKDANNVDAQRLLANSKMNIGVVFQGLKKFDEAEKWLSDAQDIRNQTKQQQTNPAILRDKAQGDFDAARLVFEKLVQMSDTAPPANADEEKKRQYAEAFNREATLADRHLSDAITSFQQLLHGDPHSPAARSDLTSCYRLRAHLFAHANLAHFALPLYELCHFEFSLLADQNPTVPEYKYLSAVTEREVGMYAADPAVRRGTMERASNHLQKLSESEPNNKSYRDEYLETKRLLDEIVAPSTEN